MLKKIQELLSKKHAINLTEAIERSGYQIAALGEEFMENSYLFNLRKPNAATKIRRMSLYKKNGDILIVPEDSDYALYRGKALKGRPVRVCVFSEELSIHELGLKQETEFIEVSKKDLGEYFVSACAPASK